MHPKGEKPYKIKILLLTGIFYLICLYGSLNLNLDEKITALLPDDDPEVAAFNTILTNVPAAEALYIQISCPDPSRLEKAGDAFYEAIKDAPYVKDIFYQFSDGSVTALMNFVHQNRYWLLDFNELEEMDSLMTQERLDSLMQEIKRSLLSPSAVTSPNNLAKDPFGLNMRILNRLNAFNSEMPAVRPGKSRLTSQDEKNLLMVVTPGFPAVDTRQSSRMLAFLNNEKNQLIRFFGKDVQVGFSGVHPATLDNSITIQADVKRAVLVLTAGILAMGFLFFSRFYHVLLIFVPSLVSLTFAAAAAGFFTHDMSAIALGCGAVLMGITVDFGIHILFHVDTLGTAQTGQIITRLRPPVLTGAATTMAAFGCLLFSSFPGQQQMGWIAITGILGAALFSVFVLKHFILIRPKPPGKPLISLVNLSNAAMTFRRRHMKLLCVFCLLLLGTGLIGMKSFRIEGDVSALNHLTPETRNQMERFLATWEQASPSIFMVQASNMEQALKKNDNLFSLLKTMEEENMIKQAASLSAIFPSREQREARLQAVRDMFPPERIASLKKAMAKACARNGFARDAFLPFFTDLSRIHKTSGMSHFSVDDFTATAISSLIRSKLIIKPVPEEGKPEKVMILTTAVIEDKSRISEIQSQVDAALPGTLFLDKPHFINKLTLLVADEFKAFVLWAPLSMFLVLWLIHRQLKLVFITITPVCVSGIITAGLLGLAGIPINLISMVFIIFVFGVGIDFSIFLAHHELHGGKLDKNITHGAVVICALTTVGAFASLIFARHDALFSIGAAGMTGMLVSLLLAFVLIPSLIQYWIPNENTRTGHRPSPPFQGKAQ